MNRMQLGGLCLAVTTLCAGCSGNDERPPGVGGCTDVLCGKPGGGTVNPRPDGGQPEAAIDGQQADVDAAPISTVDLSGSIVRLTEEQFSQEVPFLGWGYLRVPTVSGDDQVSFGGEAGVGFSATGVVSGYLQTAVGYQTYFIIALFAAIPSILFTVLAPFHHADDARAK